MARAFTLETVLRLRQHKEEAEERALAALGNQRQRVEATLARVHQELRQWTEERVREVGSASTGTAQHSSFARLNALKNAQMQLEAQLKSLEEQRLEQQATYLSARSAREMLSELKRQQRNATCATEQRREQRQLEDLMLGRFPRSKPASDPGN